MTEEQINAFRAVRQAWRSQISDKHIPENYYFTSLLRLYSEAAIREAIFFTAKFVRRQIDARKEVTLEDSIRYCAATARNIQRARNEAEEIPVEDAA